MLSTKALILWIITKQLQYECVMTLVLFMVGAILVAYWLMFLDQAVELLPGEESSHQSCW